MKADNAVSKNRLDIRQGRSPVMLSRSEASRWPVDETLRCAQGDTSQEAAGVPTWSC